MEMKFYFEIDEGSVQVYSREREEKIEQLEQKLKIAQRKRNEGKVADLMAKLAKLRQGKVSLGDEANTDETDTASTSVNTSSLSSPLSSAPPARKPPRGENLLTFSLDPLTTKSINVYAAAFSTSDERRSALTNIVDLKGTMMVRELKNADSAKRFAYSMLVCMDMQSYIEAMSSRTLTEEEESPKPSAAPSRSISRAVSRRQSPEPFARTFSGESSFAPFDAPTVTVEPARIDLADVLLGEKREVAFKLFNNSPRPQTFEVVDVRWETPSGELAPLKASDEPVFDLQGPRVVQVDPGEEHEVAFLFCPIEAGHQAYCLTVRNPRSATEVRVPLVCTVKQPQYLAFPHVAAQPTGPEFDLGFGYVDPARMYALQKSLVVQNASRDTVYLTCS